MTQHALTQLRVGWLVSLASLDSSYHNFPAPAHLGFLLARLRDHETLSSIDFISMNSSPEPPMASHTTSPGMSFLAHAAGSAATPRPTAAAVATSQKPRRRRPRTAINLPAEEISKLDKEELKKIKNRIAAARARERSQQRVSELEAIIRELWGRVQYVEGVVQELRPDLSLRELYGGYKPQVQLSQSTLTSSTGAFQAPNATFDLRELAWMFTAKDAESSS